MPRGGPLFDYNALRAAYSASSARSRAAKVREVANRFSCSPPTVLRAIKERTQSPAPGGPGKVGERSARVLPPDHPAALQKRTLFPSTVALVGRDEWVLKKGENSAKIGAVVQKGEWKGFPIYTLTLEERATCPVSCRHWGSCYGNNSHFAKRWAHGAPLEWRLEREVAALELVHPEGFAVRLHNLGDFYSVEYVKLWRKLIEERPALHVFGYTAHIDSMDDPIAYELALLVRDHWPRFAVRFSNGPIRRCSTVSIESPVQKPIDAFICPAQWTPSGKKTECCATCALCWSTDRRVAFLQH